MNSISEKQNQEKRVELLLTQRILYSQAKIYFIYRTTFALILAILGPALIAININLAPYIALVSIVYWLLDNLWFEKIESTKKIDAAKFQELFDTQVLDLNWNEVVVGSKPDHEIIGSIVQKIKPDSTLKNWYPVDDSSIDISFARFLCQRSNAWWDSTLRKMYIRFLYCVLFLIVVGIVFIGIKFKLSLGDLILGIIMPVLSLIQLIIKQVNDNISSFKRMTKLKEDIDIVIEKFLGGENVENPKELSRCFQDEIFRHRKSSPQVFDWVYWFLKNNQENQMQYSINAKMEEFKTKK